MDAPAMQADPGLFDADAFAARLATGGAALAVFRDTQRQATETHKQRYLSGESASRLVASRAWLVDQVLRHAWRRFQWPNPRDLALVAVGGYGRGELHPGSDIDLLILLRAEHTDALAETIEAFLRFLWDIGLEVGHSVRSLQACSHEAERDITVATNLMEARLLVGPAPLFRAMQASVGRNHIWPSRKFFEAKWQEQIARHHKYYDTGYNLEPNVKASPGGLRDIHMIGWVAKRHFGTGTLHGLVDHGFLSESEYQTLMECQDFLWRVRFGLHVLTGRREDRLLFDYQRTLATQFGYQDGDHNLAVEQFMKRYYRTVRELSLLNDMLLQLFQEATLHAEDTADSEPLNARFRVRNGFIEASNDNVFRRQPFALLEIFLLMAQHPEIKGLRAATIRLIRDHLHLIDERFRGDLRCRSVFMEILRQPEGITHALRRMNRFGVLGAYLPSFGRIVGQMQYDLFHVYTVDEHTLFVLRNLRRFCLERFNQELPVCSRLIQQVPKRELLYLGALFHDIAKGRGGDHSVLGAEEAEAFCLQHGLSAYDARLVGWLVRHHLILSVTAQRQDISDPEVITGFAMRVGDQVHLNYLYLLTVADIRGTNPTLWNSWKDALLLELYTLTKRALRRGLENPIDKAERIRETQDAALIRLDRDCVPTAAAQQLWDGLPEDYFLRYSADEIAWHSKAILGQTSRDTTLVLVRQLTERGGTEIFIHTRDDDYLFAATTAILERLHLTIVDARIITSKGGAALDTYIVLEESGEPIRDPDRVREIVATLHEQLASPQAAATEVQRRIPRRMRHFHTPTEVNFSADDHSQRTVVEVITGDRPGLLARIGRAFTLSGVHLQNAKVATLGERVEDVFFITDHAGQPLHEAVALESLRSNICEQLAD